MLSRTTLRLLLASAGACGYALLCHLLTSRDPSSPWAQVTVLGPMTVLGVAGLWSGGRRWRAGALALAGVGLIGAGGSGRLAVEWLYLAQHAGVHAALGLWFGSTLKPGRQALICTLAERVHGTLIASMAVYTRALTGVWTGYFATMATVSVLLFALAPLPAWSLFANLLSPLSLVLMFVGEYVWRYRRHPEFERVALLDAVRAYRAHAAAPARPRPCHGDGLLGSSS
ncbi:hypothetical protein C7444_106150 [Sphaerotilus hippei]|uniref:Transmembrane protein n=1 Tax=Sphaerotilus hippei TaxID=744406 RepID=A0A318H201_9BURK|nr:hypothetical protein [Sphaerotilus hippei]PXW96629.1 hypothetical protein C7444_106150 [Sphaerotilus hippei]